ncbi:MAG: 23S rRNA (pseudouridine(1915)-N(3))-methyltransferase RlmH [Polymorphobacter sp.]
MKLHVIARGRIGRGPEFVLYERYMKRISWPTALTELDDRGPARLPVALSPHVTIVLDERGGGMSSRALAAQLARWRDGGAREARFLIGAADGHEPVVLAQADLVLGFGLATWPHLLVRAMLAEQLYRATTIIAGHPYHRDGPSS